MKRKFDNIDRQFVVEFIEKVFESKLKKVTNRHIYLKNSNDSYFVVLGGIEDWHGIPDDVVESIESKANKYLIIALRKETSLKVYFGNMSNFLDKRDCYKRPGNNKYTFNIDEYVDYARIRQTPSVKLELLWEVPYSFTDREKQEKKEEVTKIIKKLSPIQIRNIMKSLENNMAK